MFSKPQNHPKPPPRPNSAIIPNPFDIKNTLNPTAPSESPENPQIQFANYNKYLKIGFLVFGGGSEGAVGLGMFFYVEWIWNYGEIRSGGRFMMAFGVSKGII